MANFGQITPLATATLRGAGHRRRDAAPTCFLPTRYLQLPDDHYMMPAAVAAAAEYRQTDHILPRFADFMYRIVLGAVAVRTRLDLLGEDTQGCPSCSAPNTYEHLLLRCEFVNAAWPVFRPLVDALELELPTTLHALLFEPPVTAQRYRRRAVDMMGPILRACVLHTV